MVAHLRQRRAHRQHGVQPQSQGNKIWFVNSSSTLGPGSLPEPSDPGREDRQAELRRARPFATIGVPFTWKLTIPVLFDPATGTVINNQGVVNDLHSITVWRRPQRHGRESQLREPHRLPGSTTARRFRTRSPTSAACSPSTTSPSSRPGGSSSSSSRSSSTTTPAQRAGDAVHQHGQVGLRTAHRRRLLRAAAGRERHLAAADDRRAGARRRQDRPGDDEPGTVGRFRPRRPEHRARSTPGTSRCATCSRTAPTGGMCDLTPRDPERAGLRRRRRHSGPGQGPARPGHRLHADLQRRARLPARHDDADGRGDGSAPNERLIVRYRTQLDANTQDGVALTNVAGAIQWFNGDSSNPNRVATNTHADQRHGRRRWTTRTPTP